MDKYTANTKQFLEARFSSLDENGRYYPHQPIYGFDSFHGKIIGVLGQYEVTYELMKELSCIKFHTFIDIGGAEGYTANIVRKLFNAKVMISDLSEEACKRAKEIYNISSVAADVHALPFKDGQFDVVLCSETLEHVTDWHRAVSELIRVAKKAVVINVPHDKEEDVQQWKKDKVPHGHINYFDLHSFDYLRANVAEIKIKTFSSPYLRKPVVIAEAVPYPEVINWQSYFFNPLAPLFKKVCGIKAHAFLISLDEIVSNLSKPNNKEIICTLIKDKKAITKKPYRKIKPEEIIKTHV